MWETHLPDPWLEPIAEMRTLGALECAGLVPTAPAPVRAQAAFGGRAAVRPQPDPHRGEPAMRILVAEDETIIRLDLREILERRRERLGISFYAIPQPAMESMAPLVEDLTGR